MKQTAWEQSDWTYFFLFLTYHTARSCAEAGDAIWSRMGLGAMPAGAVRPQGPQQVQEGEVWLFAAV